MTWLHDVTRNSESKNGRIRKKTFLHLRCDECGLEFDRGDGHIRKLRLNPRHFCSPVCHAVSMRRGGASDSSRRDTCNVRYGVDYPLGRNESLTKAAKASRTPEACAKRNASFARTRESMTFRLTRGLTLTRSRAEVKFLDALAKELGLELECQKWCEGWFIDAYCEEYDCWIQFDGIYWHSKPEHVERDAAQNEWFASNGKRLLRINDKDALLPDAVRKFADRVRTMDGQFPPNDPFS